MRNEILFQEKTNHLLLRKGILYVLFSSFLGVSTLIFLIIFITLNPGEIQSEFKKWSGIILISAGSFLCFMMAFGTFFSGRNLERIVLTRTNGKVEIKFNKTKITSNKISEVLFYHEFDLIVFEMKNGKKYGINRIRIKEAKNLIRSLKELDIEVRKEIADDRKILKDFRSGILGDYII